MTFATLACQASFPVVDLKAPITHLKELETRASSLEAMGIRTLEDLLVIAPPIRGPERSPAIHQLVAGQWATICGEIQSARSRFFRGKRMSQFECEGEIKAADFALGNMPFLKRTICLGAIFRLADSSRTDLLGMDHPKSTGLKRTSPRNLFTPVASFPFTGARGWDNAGFGR